MNVSLFWLLYYLTLRTRPYVCLTKENHLKFYSHTWDSLLSLSSHNINPDFFPLWPSLTKALYQRHLLLCSKSAPHRTATSQAFLMSQFWIKAVFFFSSQKSLLTETLPAGWCQLFWLLRFFWGDGSSQSGPVWAGAETPSHHRLPSAAPECFRLPDVNSCLWEGGMMGKCSFPRVLCYLVVGIQRLKNIHISIFWHSLFPLLLLPCLYFNQCD